MYILLKTIALSIYKHNTYWNLNTLSFNVSSFKVFIKNVFFRSAEKNFKPNLKNYTIIKNLG